MEAMNLKDGVCYWLLWADVPDIDKRLIIGEYESFTNSFYLCGCEISIQSTKFEVIKEVSYD